MFKAALNKLKESLFSVIPVLIVVLTLHFTNISPFTNNELILFGICIVLVIIGMWFFSIGAESSMQKMGQLIGSSITKKRNMILLIIVFFLFGTFITIAEPDLSILGDQVEQAGIPKNLLVVSIGVGVGIFIVIGAIRILFQKSLKVWILICYGIMFAICTLVDYSYIPLSFDSGGVTTGPITVPFILSIGVGIASSRASKNSNADSFGLVAFSSIGPILVVMILSLLIRNGTLTYDLSQITSSKVGDSFIEPLIHALFGTNGTIFKVFISIFPIIIFFIIYELIFIRLSFRKLLGIFLGLIFLFVGLVLFLTGVETGFLPIGQELGKNVANNNTTLFVLIGALLGLAAVFAEPAVQVLTDQVEEVSSGGIKKFAVLISIALGNAVAIGISMLRVKIGFPIYYILVPGYFIAFLISFLVPSIYTSIAFDSGGVVSGPMNTTFILPFAIGACYSINGENAATKIMTDAFGTIAIVALMPLLLVQLLGLTATIRNIINKKISRHRIVNENDNQIIHF